MYGPEVFKPDDPIEFGPGGPIGGGILQVDPLLCPKCLGEMRVIAFIEDQALIKKYCRTLDCGIRGLWGDAQSAKTQTTTHRKPPSIPSPPVEVDLTFDDTYSQLPLIDYWSQ